MKVLTIGSATQDTFLVINEAGHIDISEHINQTSYFIFETGKKLEIDSLIHFTGGGATNSATTFSRLGFETISFAAIGTDAAGDNVVGFLKNENIDTSLIIENSNEPTGTSYVLSSPNLDETIFVHRGANGILDLKKIPPHAFDALNLLYITSLKGEANTDLAHVAQQAKEKKSAVALNPGSSQLKNHAQLIKEALPFIDIFIVNSSEAKTFMHALCHEDDALKAAFEIRDPQTLCPEDIAIDQPCLLEYPIPSESLFFSIRKYFETILKMGPSIVVVTNGENGVYLATKEQLYFHPSNFADVIDTVGAGDAFGSCFSAHISLGDSVEDALRKGIVMSSSVIEQMGAKKGIMTTNELAQKFSQLDQKLLQTFSW